VGRTADRSGWPCSARRDDRASTRDGAFSYSGRPSPGNSRGPAAHAHRPPGRARRRPAGRHRSQAAGLADPRRWTRSMRGAGPRQHDWLRFARGDRRHPVAVTRSRVLFQAAVAAGVRRIRAHSAITNRRRLALPLTSRQGRGGAGPCAIWASRHAVLRPPSCRRRRRSGQQHRLAAAPLPVFGVGGTASTASSDTWTTWPGWRCGP